MSHNRTAPADGNGFGNNSHLSENVTQHSPNDAAGNMKLAPSADCVSDGDQALSDGPVAQKDRSLVIKELGMSSTEFIGPLCRPQEPEPKAEPVSKKGRKSKSKPKRKADFENELSEFYKELEELEPGDCADGSAVDKPTDESDAAAQEPRIPAPSGPQMFPKDQDSRRPHPYRYEHSDHWQPKRPRLPFQPGPNWYGPDLPFGSNRWQHSQDFRGPPPPPPPPPNFHISPYARPPGPPPPLYPPPGPLYPPVFGPNSNANYACPVAENPCRWERPQFPPPGPRYPPFNGFEGYRPPQDCNAPAYPPDGADGCREDGGDDCSYDEVTGPQPCMDWDRDRDRNRQQKPEPEPEPEPERQFQQLLHSDCDYRPAPLPLLILMRGLPGSGKSTLAKELLSSGPSGLVLSTDDYFAENNGYAYSASMIGDAHDWNQKRAREAMDGCRSPIIIDNTNLQAWEMKPYVEMALERGYNIDFHEPHTSWKLDPFELEKRNKHGVPWKKIAQMLDRFELPISVDIVLNSQDPPHKNAPRLPPQRAPSKCPPSQRPPR